MILPKCVFFSLILSWGRYSLPSVSADTNPICPSTSRSQLQCARGDNNDPLTCRVGTKSYSQLFPQVNIAILSAEQECTGNNCRYCDCEEADVQPGGAGLTGKNCDIEFNLCPDNKQVCFHGAPCMPVKDDYVCGCPYTSDPDRKYIGSHCEYEADKYCPVNNSQLTDISKSGEWFCTNNGECIDDETDLEDKCECEWGYYGLHCEYKDEEPDCTLDCENGGTCNTGVKDYTEYDDDNIANFLTDDDFDHFYDEEFESLTYCICPVGYTGNTCELQIDDCGDGVCLNGATCRLGLSGHYCDCTDIDITDSNGQSISHAGASCERFATTMCDASVDGFPDVLNTEFFCTNGGKCPTDLHLPCNCLRGFSGPRCEFEGVSNQGDTNQGDTKRDCSLKCENGGNCFFGDAPDNSLFDGFDISSPSGRHCKCPPGYTGFLCETEIEVCGDSDHHCLNNGKCVQDDIGYKCECGTDSSDMPHAGLSCESPATSYCAGPGASKDFFCTNEGVCKDQVLAGTTTHPGCTCDLGYEGKYCELKGNRKNLNGTASKAFMGFTITLFGLFAIFLAVYYSHTEKVRKPDCVHRKLCGVPPDTFSSDCDSGYDGTVFLD